jgi:hypothetical protein
MAERAQVIAAQKLAKRINSISRDLSRDLGQMADGEGVLGEFIVEDAADVDQVAAALHIAREQRGPMHIVVVATARRIPPRPHRGAKEQHP